MSHRYLALLLCCGSLWWAASPAVQAQAGGWRFTDGPVPGDVTALAATPDGALYAGTYAGVRRSTDGGQTWTMATLHAYARQAHALAVAPGQHYFVGIHQPDFFEPQNVHGVVRVYPIAGSGTPSYPSGAWGAAGAEVHDLIATDDGRGWAAIGAEVAAYTPSTDTWALQALPVEEVYDLHHTQGGALLAATTGGLYRSTDAGATWTPYALTGQTLRAVTVGVSGTTFAANASGIVYRSDNGTTWTPISCGGVVLRLHPLPDGTVVGGTDGLGLVRTTNDGWSWQYAGGTEVVPALTGDAAGTVYAAAAADGLRRSTNGGATWSETRWVDADVRHLLPMPDGRTVAVASAYYGAHAWDGAAWSGLGLDGEEVYAAGAAGSTLYATVAEGNWGSVLLRSTDGGHTWAPVRHFEYVVGFAVGADDVLLVSSSEDGFLRSTDGGATWSTVAGVSFLQAMHHVGGGVLFSYSGGYPDALLRSTDNGRSWTILGSPTFDVKPFPALDAAVRTAGGALLAAEADGLMRSTDGGTTWAVVSGSPTAVATFARGTDGVLWAGTNGGVWRSADDGATWTLDGLAGVPVHALAIGAGGKLLAGTSAGVHAYEGIATGPAGDAPTMGTALAAYPNPAGSASTIRLDLPAPGTVSVAVFDALGRRVALLHEGPLAAGRHTLALDAARLAPGAYLVRATGASGVLARRLVVTR